MASNNVFGCIENVSKDLSKTINGNETRSERSHKNREERKKRKIRKAIRKAEDEEAKTARIEYLERAAAAYFEVKAENEVLKEENKKLLRQLTVRKFVQTRGFDTAKCSEAHKEFLASKLPTVMTLSSSLVSVKRTQFASGAFGSIHVGQLTNLNIDVAVKKSKGSSLEVEARVCQALSGSKYFLHFFGICDNMIVTELIQIFIKSEQKKFSSTLELFLSTAIPNVNWLSISSGIVTGVLEMHSQNILHNDLKPDNVLIDENFVPKICDFGKATHTNRPLVYNLTDKQKKIYNEKHRHLAYELRNLDGFTQSFKTDAYSVGRILQEIAVNFNNESVSTAWKLLKVNEPDERSSLGEIHIF